jgi:hypothetical protein
VLLAKGGKLGLDLMCQLVWVPLKAKHLQSVTKSGVAATSGQHSPLDTGCMCGCTSVLQFGSSVCFLGEILQCCCTCCYRRWTQHQCSSNLTAAASTYSSVQFLL